MTKTTTTPIRLVFTQGEAEDLLALAMWAQRQRYYLLTETHRQQGTDLRLAVCKLAIATGNPGTVDRLDPDQ